MGETTPKAPREGQPQVPQRMLNIEKARRNGAKFIQEYKEAGVPQTGTVQKKLEEMERHFAKSKPTSQDYLRAAKDAEHVLSIIEKFDYKEVLKFRLWSEVDDKLTKNIMDFEHEVGASPEDLTRLREMYFSPISIRGFVEHVVKREYQKMKPKDKALLNGEKIVWGSAVCWYERGTGEHMDVPSEVFVTFTGKGFSYDARALPQKEE